MGQYIWVDPATGVEYDVVLAVAWLIAEHLLKERRDG